MEVVGSDGGRLTGVVGRDAMMYVAMMSGICYMSTGL